MLPKLIGIVLDQLSLKGIIIQKKLHTIYDFFLLLDLQNTVHYNIYDHIVVLEL